ncbi:MAG: bifunctional UDP-N-acetylglucosamine diphosphorylase/glucosamine-1-phosphate N-acetyltransferase GlmU [Dehalococcoidia bacterium]|nr:bifunctional UDP-N-acetylglucosamine diphosphorylase/glucosamine-1-phosphate N-acetyltransferase GlmU [Dehalococcoidia bacterium]
MKRWAGVVLAAGRGARMKSGTPKVLHKVCGREMVTYPVAALKGAGIGRVAVVVSPDGAEAVRGLFGESVEYVLQQEPRGTGDALLRASDLLRAQADHVLVLGADTPLVRAETLQELSQRHLAGGSLVTLISAVCDPRDGLGMVARDAAGRVSGVCEFQDLQPEAAAAPYEANAGVYCFRASWMWDNLQAVGPSPGGEVYLTSLVPMAASRPGGADAFLVRDPSEVMGVNDRRHLAWAEAEARNRVRDRWMLEGVTLVDPGSTFLDASVVLGRDTVIQPNTMVLGASTIGEACTIGPGTVIRDSSIGDGSRVVASFVEEATIEGSVEVGPFSHLRPGAYLETGVHLGNFVEVKESRLERGVAAGHFSYIGDASIGAGANLGAGMVTCNYDGVEKHRTVVGEGAFIGCDTMLVAPVSVGPGAVTGAGAVVTRDVPPGRLAVGVPARMVESKRSHST